MGMAGRWWGVVALALAMGCGGSSGSKISGGVPDASGGPADGGLESPDGGPSDAGGGGQPDAGTDGGSAPDACRTLMTAPPGKPVVYRTDPLLPYELGAPGTTDSRGEVLVPISAHFDSLSLFIFDPSGKLLSSSVTVGGGSFGLDAIGVADGFIGVQTVDVSGAGPPSHRVAKVFSDGGVQESEFDAGLASQGEDPRGGMRVLVSASKVLSAYDPDLDVRWGTQLPITDWAPTANAERLPVGVDTGGNSLVLFPRVPELPDHAPPPDAGVAGVWTDAQGRPGSAFDVGQSLQPYCLRLFPSLTGGLFARANCPEESGQFLASFASLDPHPGAVPDWLAQRPGIDLRPIRSGTGYAAFPGFPSSSPGCSIEVLTPEGRSCGRVDFGPAVVVSDSSVTDASGTPAPSCKFAVGTDGTVIALTSQGNEINGTTRWTWHWWPAFFR